MCLPLVMLLGGCATTAGYEAVLQTWVGDSADHLVSVWGIPEQEYRQNDGGKVLQYKRSGQFVIPGYTTYQAQTTYENGTATVSDTRGNNVNGTYNSSSTTYVPHTTDPTVIATSCVTRFTTNANGRIIRWSWQGNACRAKEPKKPTAKPTPPSPLYKKCTADQIRSDQCS
jgi:hypothetical protein